MFRLWILEKVGLVLLRTPLAFILALVFDLERVWLNLSAKLHDGLDFGALPTHRAPEISLLFFQHPKYLVNVLKVRVFIHLKKIKICFRKFFTQFLAASPYRLFSFSVSHPIDHLRNYFLLVVGESLRRFLPLRERGISKFQMIVVLPQIVQGKLQIL